MYRILSFCGEGIRGLISAGLLTRLTDEWGDLVKVADLMAGTSTGADIISALLVDLPPSAVYNGYQNTNMFDNPSPSNGAPAYSIDVLVGKQRDLHGQRTLGEASRRVLFTAFNVGRVDENGKVAEEWKELLLHNLETGGSPDVQIADAVVSSSAMPGMYGSWNRNIDGAFVNHDPTMAAIAVAIQNGQKLEEITAICFGTGFMAGWIGEDTSQWGA